MIVLKGGSMSIVPSLSRELRGRLLLAAVAVALSALAVGASGAEAAKPGNSLRPSASGHFAPYLGGHFTRLAVSGPITAGSCTYRQAIDNPHISSTAPRATSVHGSWGISPGRCPSTANVDTRLQAYWCDRFGCRWIVVASRSGDIRPGGGSGRRVTARRTCSSSSKTVGWRGFVDVDLNGVRDPPGFTYSPPVNLRCVP